MKNYIFNLAFLSLVLLSLTSCEKEPLLLPSEELSACVPFKSEDGPTVDPWGTFVIVDAVMCVDFEGSREDISFNHFDATKTTSCMILEVNKSEYDIDNIEKDSTTWTFIEPVGEEGKLIINGDPKNYYTVRYLGLYSTIIDYRTQSGIDGKVTRPFSGITLDYGQGKVGITVNEREGSYQGVNCRYFTRLTLIKK